MLVIATPLGWFASEFQDRRWLRLVLGSAAILFCFGVAYLAGSLQVFNDSVWFGNASRELVHVTIHELQEGHTDRVVRSLQHLEAKYKPTYENRARYDELVKEAVAEMQAGDGKQAP
jgi:hypothetical protein